MRGLVDLWSGGGIGIYLLLLVFLAAAVGQLIQLVLAPRVRFPRFVAGWATLTLAVALYRTARGYRLSLDILAEQWPAQGALLKAGEVALTSLLFGVGMVLVLLVLQLLADGLQSNELVAAVPAGRSVRVMGGLAAVALCAAGYLLARAVVGIHGGSADATLDGPTVGALSRYLELATAAAVVAGVAALGALGASAVCGLRPPQQT
ncbi:MAG: hypothetical protein GY716_22040 [bacterium]|nr:hypothetical protein [bacterium]